MRRPLSAFAAAAHRRTPGPVLYDRRLERDEVETAVLVERVRHRTMNESRKAAVQT